MVSRCCLCSIPVVSTLWGLACIGCCTWWPREMNNTDDAQKSFQSQAGSKKHSVTVIQIFQQQQQRNGSPVRPTLRSGGKLWFLCDIWYGEFSYSACCVMTLVSVWLYKIQELRKPSRTGVRRVSCSNWFWTGHVTTLTSPSLKWSFWLKRLVFGIC